MTNESEAERIERLETGMRHMMESVTSLAESSLHLSIAAKHSDDLEEKSRGEEAFQCIGKVIENLEALEALFPGPAGGEK